MLGVVNPLRRLLLLKNKPDMVIIHKGRDEEINPRNIIRYKDISKVRGKYDLLISVAGGLTPNKVRSGFFNGAECCILNIVQANDFNEGISVDSNFQKLIPVILREAGE